MTCSGFVSISIPGPSCSSPMSHKWRKAFCAIRPRTTLPRTVGPIRNQPEGWSISPACQTRAAIWTRLRAETRRVMLASCVFTVLSDRYSCAAISVSVAPAATRRATSSHADSVPRPRPRGAPAEIAPPGCGATVVELWHGSEVRMVPLSHGQWLAERLPAVIAHLEAEQWPPLHGDRQPGGQARRLDERKVTDASRDASTVVPRVSRGLER